MKHQQEERPPEARYLKHLRGAMLHDTILCMNMRVQLCSIRTWQHEAMEGNTRRRCEDRDAVATTIPNHCPRRIKTYTYEVWPSRTAMPRKQRRQNYQLGIPSPASTSPQPRRVASWPPILFPKKESASLPSPPLLQTLPGLVLLYSCDIDMVISSPSLSTRRPLPTLPNTTYRARIHPS